MIHDVKSYSVENLDPLTNEHSRIKYDGTLVVIPLIDYNTLMKKLETYEKKEKVNKEALEVAGDLASYNTYSWYEEHKGAKKGCGRRADAMILANAVRGMSLADIQAQHYPYKKGGSKKYGRDKIFSALSVKKPEDLERINGLLTDFPEVFAGIDREQVYVWMQKKTNKGGNA